MTKEEKIKIIEQALRDHFRHCEMHYADTIFELEIKLNMEEEEIEAFITQNKVEF